jgi:hypothetical protein
VFEAHIVNDLKIAAKVSSKLILAIKRLNDFEHTY